MDKTTGFKLEKKAVVEAMKRLMAVTGEDAKTIWDSYTHELIKKQFTFEDVKDSLSGSGDVS